MEEKDKTPSNDNFSEQNDTSRKSKLKEVVATAAGLAALVNISTDVHAECDGCGNRCWFDCAACDVRCGGCGGRCDWQCTGGCENGCTYCTASCRADCTGGCSGCTGGCTSCSGCSSCGGCNSSCSSGCKSGCLASSVQATTA